MLLLVERVDAVLLLVLRVDAVLLVERVVAVVLAVLRVLVVLDPLLEGADAVVLLLVLRVLLPVVRVAVAVVAVERVLFTSVLLVPVAPARLFIPERVLAPLERTDEPVRFTASERAAAVLLLP